MGKSRVEDLLRHDHERLDRLLLASISGAVDVRSYAAFRGGLLRHIGIEEKILIPFVKRRRNESALAIATQLRLDHGALAALLVPTPTVSILERIRAVLAAHNPLEEGDSGFYELCGQLAADEEGDLLQRIEAAPVVPLAAHHDGARAFANIERLLRAAGRV